jgi:hypothetical protein
MPRFTDLNDGRVYDDVTDLVWAKVPTENVSWGDRPSPVGNERIPTLDEMKTLIDGQREVPEDFAAAFGEGNAPVGWYWVYEIDPARQNIWDAADPKTDALAQDLALRKPGHVAAWFNYQGNEPCSRRILAARFRTVES